MCLKPDGWRDMTKVQRAKDYNAQIRLVLLCLWLLKQIDLGSGLNLIEGH